MQAKQRTARGPVLDSRSQLQRKPVSPATPIPGPDRSHLTAMGEYHYASSPIQRLQAGLESATSAQPAPPAVPAPNATGLPDTLKSGIESLSGMSLDQVQVHYNSPQPARLNALAYAQGDQIHLAAGQERHLPHEAWHVVQQMQGRVAPTMQMKGGVALNDDRGLEHEADVMGERALRASAPDAAAASGRGSLGAAEAGSRPVPGGPVTQAVVQRVLDSAQIEQIENMPSSLRVEYLARVSEAEWRQYLDGEHFNFFGATEEIDEIRLQRQNRQQSGEAPSSTWLEPIPAGNARLAAEQLASLNPPDDADFERVFAERDAFLVLVRKKVEISYLEELETRKDAPLLPGDPEPVEEFLLPEEDHWLPVPPVGKSLYFLHRIIARGSDSVELWRHHLLSGAIASGEDGSAPESDTGDSEIDDLVNLFAGLSIKDKLDPRIVPMDLDTVLANEKPVITKTNYDADGDIKMEDVDGISEINMSNVHGTMNISFHNVSGFVSMDIDDVNADMEIDISNVSGNLHIVMMEIDLDGDDGLQKMDIDIADVGGDMELDVSDYDQPMDVDLGNVEAGSFRRYRFNKRKRVDTDEADGEPPKSKRRLEQPARPGAVDIDDLIGLFDTLAISFRTGLDKERHNIYPAGNLTDVVVASDPTPLKTIIADKEWLGTPLGAAELKKLAVYQTSINAALASVKKSASKTNNTKLRKSMADVASFLSKKGTVPIPTTDLSGSTDYGAAGGKTSTVVGKKVVAEPLSPLSANPGTSATDGALMDSLRDKVVIYGGKSQDPIQAHLLNMKTWGPGELWNLMPASKQFNSDQETKVEDPLKRAIYDVGIVMSFEAEVTYNHYPVGADYLTAPEKYLFTKIKFSAQQWHEDTVNNTWGPDPSISNHADVKKVNQTMPWVQGNLPRILPSPNAHTETKKKPFKDLGFKGSVIEALTTYNNAVLVGATIPGTKLKRKKWNGNVAKADFLKELNLWLASKKYKGGYKGSATKAVAAALPANWKKVLDFS